MILDCILFHVENYGIMDDAHAIRVLRFDLADRKIF